MVNGKSQETVLENARNYWALQTPVQILSQEEGG